MLFSLSSRTVIQVEVDACSQRSRGHARGAAANVSREPARLQSHPRATGPGSACCPRCPRRAAAHPERAAAQPAWSRWCAARRGVLLVRGRSGGARSGAADADAAARTMFSACAADCLRACARMTSSAKMARCFASGVASSRRCALASGGPGSHVSWLAALCDVGPVLHLREF